MAAAVGRPGRFRPKIRGRNESGGDQIRLDFDRDPAENVRLILRNVVQQNGVSKHKKLEYLNSFVRLLRKLGDERSLGMGSREVLSCLQISLLHEAKEIRAATLRVLRHLLKSMDMLASFLALHMDYLVMRSLDLCLQNEVERIHALRLIRQINVVSPKEMPHSLLYSIIAVGNDGRNERDSFVGVCLCTLCEIAFRNVDLVGKCSGISTLLWSILDSHQYPRLNEALTCTVMYLMNHPRSRHFIKPNTDLETLLAPLTDSQFHFGGDTSAEEKQQQLRREEVETRAKEERETRFIASKLALITLMHTWPGLIRLCHPKGQALQSLIGILYLPYIEIRKHILEMISDVFRLPLPDWTDDFATALTSVDPSEAKDSWKLSEGFVAEEGRMLLPHCSVSRPNLVDNNIALLLSAWINGGLLEALIEIVTSSDGPLFNRAVILLGEIVHLANMLLPAECCSHNYSLPLLLSVASSCDMSAVQRHRACRAICHLNELHGLKKRGPVPHSFFLDQLLQNAGKFAETTSRHWYLRRDRLAEYYYKKMPNDDQTQHAVRDTLVNSTKENYSWDWDLIGSILKWPDERLRKMEDQTYIRFLRRVVFYFKPTNHLFSHLEMTSPHAQTISVVGCQMVDFLVSISQDEVQKICTEFLSDINHCLNEVVMGHAVPESIFGSQSLFNTVTMLYFVFIGRFTTSKAGNDYLQKTGIFQSLLDLMTSDSGRDMYVRLAISALSYSKEGLPRIVLSKALTSTSEVSRLYSTKLLGVLLRANTPGFSTWGVELLVTQLYDQSPEVATAALVILDEACDIEANLHQLIKLRPSVLHLGDRGVMLLCRFLSVPSGFRSLRDANCIPSELEKWRKTYNLRYVNIVEEMLYEALTSHEKSSHGTFTRRSLHKGPKKDVYLPVHLYGQLVLHEEGLELLKKESCLQEYFSIIRSQDLIEDSDILKMKEALWAVGHVGSSAYGICLLEEEAMVPEIIRLAEECGVFSIRGTAFYILGLLASSRRGAEVLATYGWESQCHTRRETWPVLDEQGWISESFGEAIRLADEAGSRRSGSLKVDLHRPVSSAASQLSSVMEESSLKGDSKRGSVTQDGAGESDLAPKDIKLADVVNSLSGMHTDALDNVVLRSKTLPNESENFRRYQSLPVGSKSDNSIHKHNHGLAVLQNHGRKTSDTPKRDNLPTILIPGDVSLELEARGDDCRTFEFSDTCELPESPVIRLRADSDDFPSCAELGISRCGKEPMFQVGSAGICGSGSGSSSSGGRGGPKEEHSSSDDSHRSSNKGRSDSFLTDSTTSGVSSCESGNVLSMTATLSPLSPIPSSSSLNAVSTAATTSSQSETKNSQDGITAGRVEDSMHPSTAHRKRFNLSRVPSARRHSAKANFGGSHHSLPGSRSSSFFPSYQDVVGYNTVRNLRRKRTYSADDDPSVAGSGGGGELRISRTVSLESDNSIDSNIWLSIRRNVSSISLADHDCQGQQLASNLQTFKPLSVHNRFIGIALPVDVMMMFEVIEGEDSRSSVQQQKSPEDILDDKLAELKISIPTVPPLKEDETFEHNRDLCLLCNETRQRCFRSKNQAKLLEDNLSMDVDVEIIRRKDSDAEHTPTGTKGVRSRGGSINEQHSSATPGSQTSSGSSDTVSKKLTEDSAEGRRLIRQEIIRLVTMLSSSVGLKGSEQGLLSLKQKFPLAFKDVCFFSEVASLMSSLAFRLNARRFIQELFDEIDITKLIIGPYSLLGLKEDDSTHMAPIRQDSQDNFADFS